MQQPYPGIPPYRRLAVAAIGEQTTTDDDRATVLPPEDYVPLQRPPVLRLPVAYASTAPLPDLIPFSGMARLQHASSPVHIPPDHVPARLLLREPTQATTDALAPHPAAGRSRPATIDALVPHPIAGRSKPATWSLRWSQQLGREITIWVRLQPAAALLQLTSIVHGGPISARPGGVRLGEVQIEDLVSDTSETDVVHVLLRAHRQVDVLAALMQLPGFPDAELHGDGSAPLRASLVQMAPGAAVPSGFVRRSVVAPSIPILTELPAPETVAAFVAPAQRGLPADVAASLATHVPVQPIVPAATTETAAAAPPSTAHPSGDSVTVIAYPFLKFSAVNLFLNAVSELSGVRHCAARRFRDGTLHLAVDYAGTTPFRERLIGLAGFGPRLISEDEHTLTVALDVA